MNELKVFNNENLGQVRVIENNGDPWFVLKDVCEVLGLTNATMIAGRLDEEEVTKFNLGGLSGEINIISESGLYNVILRSDKPQARQFKKWITAEVLPSIRKTGSYEIPKTATELFKLALGSIEEANAKIEAVNEDLQGFKMDMPILGIECDRITAAVKRKGVECLGGKKSNAYRDKSLRGRVYTDIYGQLKREFDITTYKAIKRSQSDFAVSIVAGYKPPFVLNEEIEEANEQVSI